MDLTQISYLPHVGRSEDSSYNQNIAKDTAKNDQGVEKDEKVEHRLRDCQVVNNILLKIKIYNWTQFFIV